MILLNEKEVYGLLDMPTAIAAAKEALERHSQGEADVPLRTNLDIAQHGGQALFMPAHVPALDCVAVKIVSVYPGNIARGLDSVAATVVVLDASTGQIAAMMNGTALTRIRTGAVQGAATDLLARPDARVGALLGAGGQAATQLEAMLCVRELEEVRIYDLDIDRARTFAAEMDVHLARHGARFVPVTSAAAAADGADVVTVVTTATTPVLLSEHVADGAHVNGVGAYTPRMQELASDLVARADLVTIDTDAALAEAGSLIVPIEAGLLDRASVVELGRVVSGAHPGRGSASQLTLFDTVGSAVLDAVAGQRVYQTAVATGVGTTVEL